MPPRVLFWYITLFAPLILGPQFSTAPGTSAQSARNGATLTSAPVQTLARGATYEHQLRTSPDGQSWSIHVVRVSRRERGLEIRAVTAAPGEAGMQRELPTKIATRSSSTSRSVIAVVNGDYDLPAPFLGVSDGLSVSSGAISTTGKPAWPAFAILTNGQPIIAVPAVSIEMRSGKRRWLVMALNKPFGTAHGAGARIFTRDFRSVVKPGEPFRAAVISALPHSLPLRLGNSVRGVVTAILEGTGELNIPAGALVYAEPASPETPFVPLLRKGDKISLKITARISGHTKVREAIGGFPVLVRDGRPLIEGEASEYLRRRHPRTAVCYNKEYVLFTVVDGRQPRLSVGMTLEELAELMASLGCEAAMNTDGGGSSVMAIAEPATTTTTAHDGPGGELKIVNSPSDGRERGRGNAWVILKKK